MSCERRVHSSFVNYITANFVSIVMTQPVGEGLAFIISLPLVLTDPQKLKGESYMVDVYWLRKVLSSRTSTTKFFRILIHIQRSGQIFENLIAK